MFNEPLISFDYAIKYLLKNKGDYDIVEGFISALLQSEGYGPVKITALLDGESNKENKGLKRSIADLIVEDEKGAKYIIEIEREYSNNFMHKACFNTSRLVVDSIAASQDYSAIKKVFHISLLYFEWGNIATPLYHGKTIIKEVDTQHPVKMHIGSQGGQMFDLSGIFPEYFLYQFRYLMM
jgi:predicted transposase/invertase (TIGR01784 family)